jgi:hypothetical protein
VDTLNESLLLDCDGELAAQVVTEVMTRHGLQVIRSFDLRTTRAVQTGCVCPYHGTVDCTCQYVVLLVYGETGVPATVLIHGRDAQAHLRIVRDASQRPGARLVEQIMEALLETILQIQVSASAPHLAETPPDSRLPAGA